MKSNTINVLGVLAGIAAGGIVALLFAPESGKDTRKKLAKKAAKLKDKVKEKGGELRQRAGEYAGAISDQELNF